MTIHDRKLFFLFYTEKSVILIVTLCIEIGFVSEFIAIIITSMDIKLLVLPALQCYQTLLSFFLSMSIERLQYGLMNQTIDEPEYLIIYVLSLKEKEKNHFIIVHITFSINLHAYTLKRFHFQ